jgi:hypothetical protein
MESLSFVVLNNLYGCMEYRDRINLSQVSKKFHLLSTERELEFIRKDDKIIQFFIMKIVNYVRENRTKTSIFSNQSYSLVTSLIESDDFCHLLVEKCTLLNEMLNSFVISNFVIYLKFSFNHTKTFDLICRKNTYHMALTSLMFMDQCQRLKDDESIKRKEILLSNLRMYEEFVFSNFRMIYNILDRNRMIGAISQLLDFIRKSSRMNCMIYLEKKDGTFFELNEDDDFEIIQK